MNETNKQPALRQSIALAILGGLIAASIGAALWAAITFYTYYQIGWMAVGVGLLSGILVRVMGQGSTPVYGVVGGLFALLGCVAGNLLALYAMIAHGAGEPLMNIVTSMSLSQAVQIFREGFSYIDILFYGIAMYEGYRIAINEVEAPEAPSE